MHLSLMSATYRAISLQFSLKPPNQQRDNAPALSSQSYFMLKDFTGSRLKETSLALNRERSELVSILKICCLPFHENQIAPLRLHQPFTRSPPQQGCPRSRMLGPVPRVPSRPLWNSTKPSFPRSRACRLEMSRFAAIPTFLSLLFEISVKLSEFLPLGIGFFPTLLHPSILSADKIICSFFILSFRKGDFIYWTDSTSPLNDFLEGGYLFQLQRVRMKSFDSATTNWEQSCPVRRVNTPKTPRANYSRSALSLANSFPCFCRRFVNYI